MKFIFKYGLISLFLFVSFPPLFAYEKTNFGLWSNIIYQNHFESNSKLLYGLQLESRFKNQPGILYQVLAHAQMGYQLSHNSQAWVGYSALPTKIKNIQDKIDYNQYLYQYYLLNLKDNQIGLRFRTEQFKHADDSELAFVYRQLITLNFRKLAIQKKYIPFISNEVFINLKSTNWNNHKSINQNRFFAGISFPCAIHHTCEIAYLNQYMIFRDNKNDLNNILYLSLIL